jgi:hypothetical protein
MNNTKLPNTTITLKEFKELLYDKFKAYPMFYTDYKNKKFIITNSFYKDIDITQTKLINFCKKLGIKYEKCYYHLSKSIKIDLSK